MQKVLYIEDFKTWKEEFIFSIEIKVRFSETDMFGHMNNGSSFTYFEEARIEYFKHVGLFSMMKKQQKVPVVADLQCDYHEQIYFGETIKVYVKTNSIGNSSMDIHYMALKEDKKLCLTGRGNMVKVDSTIGRASPLTEEEKQKILLNAKRK